MKFLIKNILLFCTINCDVHITNRTVASKQSSKYLPSLRTARNLGTAYSKNVLYWEDVEMA